MRKLFDDIFSALTCHPLVFILFVLNLIAFAVILPYL